MESNVKQSKRIVCNGKLTALAGKQCHRHGPTGKHEEACALSRIAGTIKVLNDILLPFIKLIELASSRVRSVCSSSIFFALPFCNCPLTGPLTGQTSGFSKYSKGICLR